MGEREKEILMKIIEFKLQSLYYYIHLNNNRHNKNFPAFVCPDGYISWWLNKKYHNPYGWAVKYRNGEIDYWLNDIRYNKEQWEIERIKYL